ncbi:MAG: hypothetical protein JNL44_07965 [Gemmatimonadetes bacterium]|nr:hypothetical protein [Gemmatimonadota bacterium]
MHAPNRHALFLTAALALSAASCAETPPTASLRETAARVATTTPGDAHPKVTICHTQGRRPRVIDVAFPALPAHLAHGDHVALLLVDQAESETGDGVHFTRIGDALAEARAIRTARGETERGACRIEIGVASGTYRGGTEPSADPTLETFPLVVDVPDVTLSGAFRMGFDAAGRATGVGEDGESTVLLPNAPLTTVGQFSYPLLVVNGRPDGTGAHGTVIRGFVFRSGRADNDPVAGGLGVLSLRVRELRIVKNRFEAGFSESIDLRASSGEVGVNHLGGGGGTCDICLAGPGDYTATGNTLLAGGIPGILVTPSVLLPVPASIEQFTLPASSTVRAELVNNEVRDHLRRPVGVGLRVGAVGVGAPNVAGTAIVEARDNLLINNTFGMIVEAAFPVAGTLRRGDITFVERNNTVIGSCQNDLLVSLSRHTTGLGLSNAPYLLNSSYNITLDHERSWDSVWYSHPAGFGNTLTVNGAEIANGAHHAYDATRTCAP